MVSETDRIEKQILLRASRQRVWRAITDTAEFAAWFGVQFDRPFAVGQTMRGQLIGTAVDAEVAKMQREHDNVPFEITVDRIEPERLFAFRWHPFALDPEVDYSAEPTTLVVFGLEEAEGGVLLKVSESGFDSIPLDRRAQAFSANEGGWSLIVELIRRHLAQTA